MRSTPPFRASRLDFYDQTLTVPDWLVCTNGVSRGTSNVPGNWSRTLFIPENSQEICLLCTSARSGEREYYFLPFSPQVFFTAFQFHCSLKNIKKNEMCILYVHRENVFHFPNGWP